MRSVSRIIVSWCEAIFALLCSTLLLCGGEGCRERTPVGPHEVPRRETRLAFRRVAGCQLPKNAENVRAIVDSGRAKAIFVRFEADQQGQKEIVEALAGDGAVARELDARELAELRHSSPTLYDRALEWQKKTGISLYVPSAIRSARLCEGSTSLPSSTSGESGDSVLYKVLIDCENGVVYVFATRD